MLVLDISRYAVSKITALLIRFNQVIGHAAKNVRLFVYSFFLILPSASFFKVPTYETVFKSLRY